MSSVCLYFEVHQPYRLKPYTFFDISRDHRYFDEKANREILRKVATKCYLPANEAILRLIDKHKGRFRVAYSLTGIAIEQLTAYAPEALRSFQALSETGCVEFLGETYYHSLASIYDEADFVAQVRQHGDLMRRLFRQSPRIFRNTELVYNDRTGALVKQMGFEGMLAEGADDILEWRSPNFVYRSTTPGLRLLLKNYRLSDDVAFRFSNRSWDEFPLTAEKFANWIHRVSGNGDVVNLFMDYETFGEHQWEATGIFDFLQHLPDRVFAHPDWDFCTPSEAVERYSPVAQLSFPRTVSWADVGRDLTAWDGNHMQRGAIRQIYDLVNDVKRMNNPETTDIWRKLQTSDHFYYMCTKWSSDGDVHKYFSPYNGPYEAFITYMNILTDFREWVVGNRSVASRSA